MPAQDSGKLTNADISAGYRDRDYYFMRSDFLGAFAYWVVVQSPYDTPDISEALTAFCGHIQSKVHTGQVVKFTFEELRDLLHEDVLESIPAIEKLNHRKNGREGMGFCDRYHEPDPDDDFIDLGALSRNIFYTMLRESITQGS